MHVQKKHVGHHGFWRKRQKPAFNASAVTVTSSWLTHLHSPALSDHCDSLVSLDNFMQWSELASCLPLLILI